MILSVTNVKGGVGKTTTAVNLAAAFAGSGLDVLLVDLDPQGSASFSLGVAQEDLSPSVAGVLLDGKPLAEVVRETDVEGLDLVTGSIGLAGADLALARKRDAAKLLGKALRGVRRRYDFVVIDCPPGMSVLTVNALAASQAYLVPVVPHDLAAEALHRFFAGFENLGRLFGRRPQLLGILLTMVDHRTAVTEELVTKIRRQFGRQVFKTEIPINVRLAEAPGYGLTIFDYERWSTGGRAYSLLGAEVLRRGRGAGLI